MSPRHRFHKKRPFWRGIRLTITVAAVFIIGLIGLSLSVEVHHPKEIGATPTLLPGEVEARHMPDMVIQHVGEDGTVWGMRGYCVYTSKDGENFEKAFSVPSGGLPFWLGNLPWLRAASGRHELCEVMPLHSGTILAFAGGYLWRSTDGGMTCERVHRVKSHGISRGRGIMPEALAEDRDGVLYYGEYHRNITGEPVSIYRSLDDGKTWEVSYEFKARQIRHIHSISVDPFTNAVWLTTGDRNEESIIAYSVDKAKTFRIVGTGSQEWRAVDLIFTKDSVIWGTDCPQLDNWICRWDRSTRLVEKVCKVDGPIYYATTLCDGTLVVGRAAEGGRGERNDMVSIWLSRDERRWINIPLATRKSQKRQAVLRFARGKCLPYLMLTPLNTEAYSQALLKMDMSDDLFAHGKGP